MAQTVAPASPRGRTRRPEESCRAIRVYQIKAAPTAVPMALESVHAGFPSVAQDYFSGDFSFDEHVIKHPDTTFIVTVAGDSMQGAGIWDGDLLVVDRALTPRSGDVVIAVLNGELTVKRLLLQGHRPVLHAENPRYPDFRPSDDEELMVWGVVTGNFHSQRQPSRTSRAHPVGPTPGPDSAFQDAPTFQGTPTSQDASRATRSATPNRTSGTAWGATSDAHDHAHTRDRYPHDGWAR